MARPQTATLPLTPLARGAVLLPGLVQRITVSSGRPDIPALLAHVYERAAAKGPDGRIDGVPIACVPVSSPPVGPAGQLLVTNGDEPDGSPAGPAAARSHHLFGFGVAAKVVGIDGRGSGEFALRVEGTARVRVDAVTHERPFFEVSVTYLADASTCPRPRRLAVAKPPPSPQSTSPTSSCSVSSPCSSCGPESSSPY